MGPNLSLTAGEGAPRCSDKSLTAPRRGAVVNVARLPVRTVFPLDAQPYLDKLSSGASSGRARPQRGASVFVARIGSPLPHPIAPTPATSPPAMPPPPRTHPDS